VRKRLALYGLPKRPVAAVPVGPVLVLRCAAPKSSGTPSVELGSWSQGVCELEIFPYGFGGRGGWIRETKTS